MHYDSSIEDIRKLPAPVVALSMEMLQIMARCETLVRVSRLAHPDDRSHSFLSLSVVHLRLAN
mgnify:CR=1 FL=1